MFEIARVTARIEEIAFGPDTDRTPLGKGWSVNEPGWIWAVGDSSEVRFAWYGEGDLAGELAAEPYTEPDTPQQEVTVLANGRETGKFAMPPGPGVYIFAVPAALLVRGENTLTLRYATMRPEANPFRPGNEYRRLAVMVKRLRLLPAGRTAPAGRVPTVRPEGSRIRQEAGTEFAFVIGTGERPSLEFAFEASPVAPASDSVGSSAAALSILWRPEGAPSAEKVLYETALEQPTAGAAGDGSGKGVIGAGLPRSSRGSLVFRLTGSTGLVLWTRLALRDSSDENAPPSVVLVIVDALRRDHVGFHGYGRDTTPNLDRLAPDSVVFENQISQAPWTPPSFGTLFTGKLPHVHGAGLLTNEPKRFRMMEIPTPLPSAVPTLAEILSGKGYATAAFYTNRLLDLGLLRGFEEALFIGYPAEGNVVDLVDRSIAFEQKEILAGRPFFAVLDISDTHEPLTPPEDFRIFSRLFPQDPGVDLSAWEGLKHLIPPYGEKERRMMAGKVALYDDSIRFVDSQIARLVEHARTLSPFARVVVFVTADHGEEFWEHAEPIRAENPGPRWTWGISHGHSLYGELLRVPLLVWSNRGLAARRERSLTQALDVAPTILALAGADPDRFGMTGRNLLAPAPSPSPAGVPAQEAERFALGEYTAYGHEKKAIQSLSWKLIWTPFLGKVELFNVERDPGEKQNLAATEKEVVREMFGRLEALLASPPETGPEGAAAPALTQEQEENLRTLGYLE